MVSKMATKGHIIFFILLIQKIVLDIDNILWKLHSNGLNGSGDTLLNLYTLSFEPGLIVFVHSYCSLQLFK